MLGKPLVKVSNAGSAGGANSALLSFTQLYSALLSALHAGSAGGAAAELGDGVRGGAAAAPPALP